MGFSLAYGIYFLVLIVGCSISVMAQTYSNTSLGSSLIAGENQPSWVSPSGEFAFGFQMIANSGFLLAIWFDKIPQKTIIWSANRNSLVQKRSKVELTKDGRLVLSDKNRPQIWASDSDATRAYAAMLDNGNFVLAGQNSAILWQSFRHPTDTLLPNQVLYQSSVLISSVSEQNYSTGRFQFQLQSNGNLVLNVRNHLNEDGNNYAPYWSSKTAGGFQVQFNESGNIYVNTSNGNQNRITSNPVSSRNFYQRAILEYDGVFRQYIYLKAAGSGLQTWSSISDSYIPSNLCAEFVKFAAATVLPVSLYCGQNSYCMITDDNRPICSCAPGYRFLDPDNKFKGCELNFVPQSCSARSEQSTELFNITAIANMDWPGFDYASQRGSINDCKDYCLNDCYCGLAIFSEGYCWKKTFPYHNGWINPSFPGQALIKIREDSSFKLPNTDPGKKNDGSIMSPIGLLLMGISLLLCVTLLISWITIKFLHKKSRVHQASSSMSQLCKTMPETNLRHFTCKQLEEATNGFKEELGRGASATVYKGVLTMDKGNNPIAVKVLSKIPKESEREFQTEVSAIGKTNHKNLVQLLGFRNEGQHQLLVYDYMSNGWLASFLFGASWPNWHQRKQIALGTAKGLLYLHDQCRTQTIHCDIKPQNVLLDDSYTAKISDFGLAKLLKIDETRTKTCIRGTKGYVAPEWFKNCPVTSKVDVYSFGILLLEIICCRKSVYAEDEDQIILADWAYDRYKEGRLDLLVENDEDAMKDMESVKELVMIAVICIREDPFLRPSMKEVVKMLESAVEATEPQEFSSTHGLSLTISGIARAKCVN